MSKKNKLLSVKLLPQQDLAIEYIPTQSEFPEFHFSVKGIVEGKKLIFKGCMKIIAEKKVQFTFEEVQICLDDWFEECQEKLKDVVINQLANKYQNNLS